MSPFAARAGFVASPIHSAACRDCRDWDGTGALSERRG